MTRPADQHRPDHEEYAELVAGWVLHALEPDEEARFARHLRECGRCTADVADYSAALAELALAAPTAEPPAELGRRIQEAVRADIVAARPALVTPAGPPRPVTMAGPRTTVESSDHSARFAAPAADTDNVVSLVRRPARWRFALSAAAALALVVSLAGVAQYQRAEDAERRMEQVAAQLRQREAQMAEVRAAADRQATLVRQLTAPGTLPVVLDTASGTRVGYVLVRDGQVQVLPDGLRPNDPTGTIYVLWMIAGAGGNPKPVSAFDVRENEMRLVGASSLPSSVSGRVGFAVSLEPGRQIPEKPTTVVADGAVTI